METDTLLALLGSRRKDADASRAEIVGIRMYREESFLKDTVGAATAAKGTRGRSRIAWHLV
jgi:hypothetical protein